MNSNTHIQKYLNMHHTNGNPQNMDKNTMGKIVKFSRDNNITKKKINLKSGGIMIYYGVAVDSSIPVTLGSTTADKSKETTQT